MRAYRCRNCQLLGTMIPHAAITLVGTAGTLVVTVVGTPLWAFSMSPTGLPSRQLSPLLLARFAAVDVPTVASAVDPEFLAAALAWSYPDFQWSSARPKNWTPSLLGRILAKTCVDWSGVRRFGAAPRRLGALTPGLLSFFLSTAYCCRHLRAGTRPSPLSCPGGTRAPLIPLKTGPRYPGGDIDSTSFEAVDRIH